MITVWLHEPTGDIVLAWECYARVDVEIDPVYSSDATFSIALSDVNVDAYEKVGVAVENKHGVTCIMNNLYLNHFAFIGVF